GSSRRCCSRRSCPTARSWACSTPTAAGCARSSPSWASSDSRTTRTPARSTPCSSSPRASSRAEARRDRPGAASPRPPGGPPRAGAITTRGRRAVESCRPCAAAPHLRCRPRADVSAHIALATSADHPEGHGGEHLLVDALTARGMRVTWAVWDDPVVDWAGFDLVVIRATWDYPARVERFRSWVRSPAVATRLVNPPNLVLGNLHKGYLADLGDLAVPTVVVPAGMTVDLRRLRWAASVVKPAVGVGGQGAVRRATQEDLDRLTLGPDPVDAVVQPYL